MSTDVKSYPELSNLIPILGHIAAKQHDQSYRPTGRSNMQFSLNNINNFNTLFVGAPHQQESNLGGNLFYGDAGSFSPQVYDYVIKRFCVQSMLDVGSGLGHLAYHISHNYHIPVIGIEGLPFNVANAYYPLVHHDLTKGPFVCGPVDLVSCVEVVEHIEPQFMDNLLDTLTRGKLLLMTHAIPSQHGDFHVNEQPSSYWIEKLASRGFGLLAQDTQVIRKLAATESHFPTYFAQSGLLFGRLPVAMPNQNSANQGQAAAQQKPAAQTAENAAPNTKADSKANSNTEQKEDK